MMPAILAWLKANVLIVVLGALVLILPPAGIVGATIWNGAIKKQVEEAYKTEEQSLKNAAKTTYVIPSISAEDPGWTSPAQVPNQALTEFVAAERSARQGEIDKVVKSAVLFNKGETRAVLVDGLFPSAGDDRLERRLIGQLVDRLSGQNGQASAYEELFRRIGAGMPTPAAEVARRVIDTANTARESAGTALSEADAASLRERLTGLRVASYRQRAQELGVYGGPEVLAPGTGPGPNAAGGVGISTGAAAGPSGGYGAGREPGRVSPVPIYGVSPDARPDVGEAFVWQWDYWIVEDLLAAVNRANRGPGGVETQVPESAVKRIESIVIDRPALVSADAGFGDPSGGFADPSGGFGDPAAIGGGAAALPPLVDKLTAAPTYTKRASSATNQTYDVRTVRLTVIASSAKLHRLLDAVSSTNFMTVTGLRLSEVDVAAHLEQGFFYGDEHVERAELEIETVWLRFWMADAMPKRLKMELAIPEPVMDPAMGDPAMGDPNSGEP